jgi:hypothetical protein
MADYSESELIALLIKKTELDFIWRLNNISHP